MALSNKCISYNLAIPLQSKCSRNGCRWAGIFKSALFIMAKTVDIIKCPSMKVVIFLQWNIIARKVNELEPHIYI